MKTIIIFLFTICFLSGNAQIENIVIVTTDGFRWQDVFNGMDSTIAINPNFNQGNSAGIFYKMICNIKTGPLFLSRLIMEEVM